MDRREFIGGVTMFTLMRGGVFPKLDADVSAPLILQDGLACTPVTIGGKGPYPFLVSSAQTFFNISANLARDLGLKREKGRFKGITQAGDLKFDVFSAPDLTLGDDYRITDVLFLAQHSFDQGPYRGCARFITEVATRFDFEGGRMTLLRDRPGAEEGTPLKMVRPSGAVFAKVPVVTAELDGRPLTLIVNTSLSDAVELNPETVERLNLWDAYGKGEEATELFETIEMPVRTVRAGTFTLGGFPLSNPTVRLIRSDDPVKNRMLAGDGQIGMEVLRRFQITFDPYKEVVWLKPNTRLKDPFA